MKSSSQLFPVELVSAEVREHYYEDSYSLKHNKCVDKSVEIALIHLHAEKRSNGPQILFVHDIFQSHWQWTQGKYQILVEELLQQGYSLWFMDWRSHGSSKKNKQPHLNHMTDMALNDLTSVTEFIHEQSRQDLVLVGKGYGAQMALIALEDLKAVERLVLIDAVSVKGKRRYWLPGLKLSKQLRLVGRSWIEGQGPELESAELLKQQLQRSGLSSLVHRSHFLKQAQRIRVFASQINWICTSAGAERSARRLARKQARIHRVKEDACVNELRRLIPA